MAAAPGKSIMYIGGKSRKDDRPNNNLRRVWNGTGDVIDQIPFSQAEALIRHADEFVDVTDLSAEQRVDRANQAKAAVKALRRESRKTTGPGGQVLLSAATEEQLVAQLAEIRGVRGVADVAPQDTAPAPSQISNRVREDEAFIEEKVLAAMEVIAQEANPDDLDEDGVPTLDAINARLEFAITADEYQRALGNEPEAQTPEE